jgi:HK97 family phage prohead protease
MHDLLQFLRLYSGIAQNSYNPQEVDEVFQKVWPKLVVLEKTDESARKVTENYRTWGSKVIALDQLAHEVHAHNKGLLGELFDTNPEFAIELAMPVLNELALESDFQLLSRGYASDAFTDQMITEEGLVIAGYASVAIVDQEDHLIPLDVLQKAFDDFMARGEEYRAIQFSHGNVRVGTVLESWNSKTTGKQYVSGVDEVGLYIVCRLREDTTFTKRIVDAVRDGSLRSFSVFGLAKGKPIEKTRGKHTYFEVVDFELEEITVCAEGVNQGAKFTILKSVNSVKLESIVLSLSRPVDLGWEVEVSDRVKLPFEYTDEWLSNALKLRLYRYGIKGKFSLALQPTSGSLFVMKGDGYRLSDYTVALVGSVASKGYSMHDFDILIRTTKNSPFGWAIKRAIVPLLPKKVLEKARFIFSPEGPHGDFIPLFSLRAVSVPSRG